MSTQSAENSAVELPAGTWRVDPASSELSFRGRGMFGLAPVKGTFGEYEGVLHVDGSDVTGELRIASRTLDTHHARRDEHLRSADFFDSERAPTVRFRLLGLRRSEQGAELTGELVIRQTHLRFSAPLEVRQPSADELHLETRVSVDRSAAGLSWNKMGMIQGKAKLHAALVLRPG